MLSKVNNFFRSGQSVDKGVSVIQSSQVQEEEFQAPDPTNEGYAESSKKRLDGPFWKTAVQGLMGAVIAVNTFGGVANNIAEASEGAADLMQAAHKSEMAVMQVLDSDNTPPSLKLLNDDLDEIKNEFGVAITVFDFRDASNVQIDGVNPVRGDLEEWTNKNQESFKHQIGSFMRPILNDENEKGCLLVVANPSNNIDPNIAENLSDYETYISSLGVGGPGRVYDKSKLVKLAEKTQHLSVDTLMQISAFHEQGHCLDPFTFDKSDPDELKEGYDKVISGDEYVDYQYDNQYKTYRSEVFAITYSVLRWVQAGGSIEAAEEELMLRNLSQTLRTSLQDEMTYISKYEGNTNYRLNVMERTITSNEKANELAKQWSEQQDNERAITNKGAQYYIGDHIESIRGFLDTHDAETIHQMSIKDIVEHSKNITENHLMSENEFNGEIGEDDYSFKKLVHETRIDTNGDLLIHPDVLKNNGDFAVVAQEALDYFGWEHDEKDSLIPYLKNDAPTWVRNHSSMEVNIPEGSPVDDITAGKVFSLDKGDGARIVDSSLEDGKLVFQMEETNGDLTSIKISADGTAMRYDSNGNLASLADNRAAITYPDGQVIHKHPKPEEVTISDHSVESLDLTTIDVYMNAKWTNVDASHEDIIAVSVKKGEGDKAISGTLSGDIKEELENAVERADLNDKGVVLYSENGGNTWQGLTQSEWGTAKESLKEENLHYTVVKKTSDGFAAIPYQGNTIDNTQDIAHYGLDGSIKPTVATENNLVDMEEKQENRMGLY